MLQGWNKIAQISSVLVAAALIPLVAACSSKQIPYDSFALKTSIGGGPEGEQATNWGWADSASARVVVGPVAKVIQGGRLQGAREFKGHTSWDGDLIMEFENTTDVSVTGLVIELIAPTSARIAAVSSSAPLPISQVAPLGERTAQRAIITWDPQKRVPYESQKASGEGLYVPVALRLTGSDGNALHRQEVRMIAYWTHGVANTLPVAFKN